MFNNSFHSKIKLLCNLYEFVRKNIYIILMDYLKYKLIETYINMVLNSCYHNARPKIQVFFFF